MKRNYSGRGFYSMCHTCIVGYSLFSVPSGHTVNRCGPCPSIYRPVPHPTTTHISTRTYMRTRQDLRFVLLPDMAAAARQWSRKVSCGLLYSTRQPPLTNRQVNRLVRKRALAGLDVRPSERKPVRAILLPQELQPGTLPPTAAAASASWQRSIDATGSSTRVTP
jgi:hypothetical protein